MREISLTRKTGETEISLRFALKPGPISLKTPVGFLNHMLHLFAAHGGFSLDLVARGDIEVDYHHTVEDIGICLGEALGEALGEREGISRYGHAVVPMEEALARVSLDLCRRPALVFRANIPVERIGLFDTELVKEFLKALAYTAPFTLHVEIPYGENAHHMIEAAFKALGRALRQAISPGHLKVASTKGVL
ncbi:imidazoleglycerol-phosphate dehydratase HisB [Thermosulfuriphilus ammonigenes]|uniref:Imidazoleglycerol-phosphate dehydratase n=1 Tax=Thermosulfuriphilus ammonigenes TaxID=1936021 RepID=A0A6G7PVC1_9BACT|nr:imidazoleglycerol-phosphate dehydratase HisB [Thermosulfuriphilus ammonigenes]MBA2848304.1 imidazoleglycerol-phosphate dehydratase [Thermosulfuriphilus ammonigenes]QIJ71537.1 imidazoleglycerol-phosphate dehydratase HisB [Thermosulfuriphilus ammonigenes]HFB83494.1 imidazoleglycerol-phosphate dehydratase HisB [Thermodesulfatator sp.]